jgi:RNA recognition motif-containing protein
VARLYIGNLSWQTTEAELRDYFAGFGQVESADIITDRESGRSRGFAFVTMDDTGARNAIAEADGRDFGGRPLRVSEARERQGGGGRRD